MSGFTIYCIYASEMGLGKSQTFWDKISRTRIWTKICKDMQEEPINSCAKGFHHISNGFRATASQSPFLDLAYFSSVRCLGLLQRCLGLLQRLGAKWRLGAKIGIFFFKYPDIFFGLNLSASSKTASEFLSEPPGGRNRNPVTRSVRSSPYPEPGR